MTLYDIIAKAEKLKGNQVETAVSKLKSAAGLLEKVDGSKKILGKTTEREAAKPTEKEAAKPLDAKPKS